MSAELITILWRDIPAQVTARDGRRKASVQLPDRFQAAIDQAAMRAGKESTDDYLAEWRRVSEPCGPDLQSEAEAAAARLEQQFSTEVLGAFVKAGGFQPVEKAR